MLELKDLDFADFGCGVERDGAEVEDEGMQGFGRWEGDAEEGCAGVGRMSGL